MKSKGRGRTQIVLGDTGDSVNSPVPGRAQKGPCAVTIVLTVSCSVPGNLGVQVSGKVFVRLPKPEPWGLSGVLLRRSKRSSVGSTSLPSRPGPVGHQSPARSCTRVKGLKGPLDFSLDPLEVLGENGGRTLGLPLLPSPSPLVPDVPGRAVLCRRQHWAGTRSRRVTGRSRVRGESTDTGTEP